MEDTLERLLDAETRAEALVTKAQAEREQLIQQALQQAKQAEQAFKANIPQLQHHFLAQAEVKATQSIAELNKRYETHKTQLLELAERNQQQALEAAIQLLMQVGQADASD